MDDVPKMKATSKTTVSIGEEKKKQLKTCFKKSKNQNRLS